MHHGGRAAAILGPAYSAATNVQCIYIYMNIHIHSHTHIYTYTYIYSYITVGGHGAAILGLAYSVATKKLVVQMDPHKFGRAELEALQVPNRLLAIPQEGTCLVTGVCVCVYIYIYMYIYVYTYMYIYPCVYIRI